MEHKECLLKSLTKEQHSERSVLMQGKRENKKQREYGSVLFRRFKCALTVVTRPLCLVQQSAGVQKVVPCHQMLKRSALSFIKKCTNSTCLTNRANLVTVRENAKRNKLNLQVNPQLNLSYS